MQPPLAAPRAFEAPLQHHQQDDDLAPRRPKHDDDHAPRRHPQEDELALRRSLAAAPLRLAPPRPAPAAADPDTTIRVPLAVCAALPDAELARIGDIGTLLGLLAERHAASRAAPPQDMRAELANHVKYAYPAGDTARLRAFFQALPGDAYDAAGEAILAHKQALETQMRAARRKRRRVMDDEVEAVKAVAAVRKEKLDLTLDKRRQLRGNVERYLVENGFRG